MGAVLFTLHFPAIFMLETPVSSLNYYVIHLCCHTDTERKIILKEYIRVLSLKNFRLSVE